MSTNQECPVCRKTFPSNMINRHVDQCLSSGFVSSSPPRSSSHALAATKGPKPATEKFCRQMQEIEQQLETLLGSIKSAEPSVLVQLHSPCKSLISNLKRHRVQLGAVFRSAQLEVDSPPSTPVSQHPPPLSKEQSKEPIDLTMDISPEVERRKRPLEGSGSNPDVVGVDGVDLFDNDDASPMNRRLNNPLSSSLSSTSRKVATSSTKVNTPTSKTSQLQQPPGSDSRNTRTSSQKIPTTSSSSTSSSSNSFVSPYVVYERTTTEDDDDDDGDEKGGYVHVNHSRSSPIKQEIKQLDASPRTGVSKVAIASTKKSVMNGNNNNGSSSVSGGGGSSISMSSNGAGKKPDFKERKKRDSQESRMDYGDSPDRDQQRTKSPSHMEDDDWMTKYHQEEQKAKEARETKMKTEEEEFQALLKAQGTCAVCNIYKGVDQALIHEIEKCSHMICTECLCQYLEKLIKDGNCDQSMICCPMKYLSSSPSSTSCSSPLPEWQQRKVLGPEKFGQLQDACLAGLLKNSADFVSCVKCGQAFEAVAGSVQLNTDGSYAGGDVDADGKPLTKEGLQDRAKNRFRCPKCQINFCRGCKAQPYHLNYTCDSWSKYQKAKHCRFCSTALNLSNRAPLPRGLSRTLEDVCNTVECKQRRDDSCDKKLPCGHLCRGVKAEAPCLPCLDRACVGEDGPALDDFCNICWTEDFSVAPTIQLGCKHTFHYHCIKQKLEKKWPGARIVFGFLACPLCKVDIAHPALESIVKPHLQLKALVQQKALERLKMENMENDKRLLEPSDRYYKQPAAYAMDCFAFYPCAKCLKPYFGGMRKCEEAGQQGEEKFDPKELVCGSCAAGSNVESCKIHKKDYIEYKCKFCCGLATWYCWGNTHFCENCHKKQEKGDYLNRKPKSAFSKCAGGSACPLKIQHPPAPEEFALGCGICRPRIT